jgi:hypothetical protein
MRNFDIMPCAFLAAVMLVIFVVFHAAHPDGKVATEAAAACKQDLRTQVFQASKDLVDARERLNKLTEQLNTACAVQGGVVDHALLCVKAGKQ